MGLQQTVTRLVVWWLLVGGVISSILRNKREYSVPQLCDTEGCNCTSTASSWKTINCTFGSTQNLVIYSGLIPPNTIELSIIGGNEVVATAQSFNVLKGFNLLRIDGTKTITIRKHAFDNLNSTSLDFQVVGCNRFVLEQNAFKNMQTPIRADVSRCSYVTIESSAFSRLQEAKFSFVKRLELQEGAFTFEKQGDNGRHGPVTNLSFLNVTIPKIPRATFTTALSEINIRNSEIQDIFPEAFKAGQITAIYIDTSTIHRMHSGALSSQTLIYYFILSKCTVYVLESHAIMAAISNLTVQFSSITEIKSGAINSSVTANIVISDNEIKTIYPHGLVFNNWNHVAMENNIILYLNEDFLEVPYNTGIVDFSFRGNEIWNINQYAFKSIPELQQRIVNFNFVNNSFNQTCYCNISEWIESLLNNSDTHYVLSSSFCIVNSLLSSCFQIGEGLINMKNFTELVCGPGKNINCEPYKGETKILNTTSTLLLEDRNNSNLILVLTLISLLIIALFGTFVILLIRGGLWLKKKGYCVRFEYNQNEVGNEDEGAMVNEEANEKFDFPEELTPELLLELREQLENPETHNKAREMIEILYERFIVDESYTNNNRQDEEAHLYEELGNMQSGHFDNNKVASNGVANFLKVMEDKLNLPLIDQDDYKPPPLVNEYSEPTDAAVHLYSELKNKSDDDNEKKDSVNSYTSNGSKMAFRPLPEKPADEAGPSSKY